MREVGTVSTEALARRLAEAGELLAIRLVDHIILSSGDRWVSLGRQGAW